jgi:hypothetical protein
MGTKPTTKPTPPSPERSLDAARSVVTAAERVLADLQGRRGAMLARSSALDHERKRASFGAFTLGGDGARLLEQLRDQMAVLDAEITDIGNAIEVATMRVADAKHALERVLDVKRQQDIASELQKLVGIAKRLDAALADFTGASRDMVDVADSLRRLDHAHPNQDQINVLGWRALSTVFASTMWSNRFERLQPAARTTFTELAGKWAQASPSAEQQDKEFAA